MQVLKTLILNSSGSSISFLAPSSVALPPLPRDPFSDFPRHLLYDLLFDIIFLLIGIIRLLVIQGRSLWNQLGIGSNEKKFYLLVSPGISGPLVSIALLLSGTVPSWPSTFYGALLWLLPPGRFWNPCDPGRGRVVPAPPHDILIMVISRAWHRRMASLVISFIHPDTHRLRDLESFTFSWLPPFTSGFFP